ncbi:helix-turn-helix domain-containing protein [Actinomadura rubrisoli]|uniref:XRE family transcriptional regulator n=1 Tax=Actinomadura rubrisoli TaxID=2530368 RepID=A0A4R5ADD4_9ACTN|nr:helix-turn-helix transcriptional regulator [Actinomadura rubrisoli]TDD68844.1 XRE family transcriptional regulator [Actinomadura rubrisoli]
MSSQAQQAREAFGARLRDLRKDAGLTGRALAALAGWHLSKVSRIEHGKRAANENDIRIWCRHCNAEDHILELIATVRNINAMWLEWRRTLQTGTKIRQQHSISLYEQTRVFRVYHPALVWGTLQTAEYATAMLEQVVDFYEIPDDIERGVAARMERQQYLYQGDRRYNVILGEQSLYTNIGGPDVLRGQLDRLLAVLSLPRLSLGIIPTRAAHQLWPGNSFIMFDERTVMVETYSAEFTITQPHEIALYAKAFAKLQWSAVYGRPARELIARALESLG